MIRWDFSSFFQKTSKKRCLNFSRREPGISQKCFFVILGHWSWNVLNCFGTITTKLSYMRSPDARGEKLRQRGLSSVSRLWSNNTQKTWRRWKPIFISLLKRRTEMRINFSFLSNRCAFDSFCHWFSTKVLKLNLLSFFFLLALISRLF